MNDLTGFFRISLVVVIVVALIFLYLWQTWRVIYLQRRVNNLERELVPIEERKKDLQLQVARYFSYERIERIARERLGMIEPQVKEEKTPEVP